MDYTYITVSKKTRKALKRLVVKHDFKSYEELISKRLLENEI